jgi:nucleoside-diphosphate-sugar epimerase
VTLTRSEVDLLEPGSASEVVDRLRPEVVLHLAWCASGDPGYRESPDNARWVASTLELAGACRTAGARLCAVGTVVDDQPGPDAYSRAKAELRSRLAPRVETGEVTWLRPHYVFDPSRGRPAVVAEALAARAEDREAVLLSPEARHDFVHVTDAGAALRLAVRERLGGWLDVGSGRCRAVADLVGALGARWAVSPESAPVVQHDGRCADTGILRRHGWRPVATEEFFDDD